MNTEQFCYWLQGFGELTPEPPTPEQWQAIKEHLATVFHKVTPPAPGRLEFAQELRDEWNAHAADKQHRYYFGAGTAGRVRC